MKNQSFLFLAIFAIALAACAPANLAVNPPTETLVALSTDQKEVLQPSETPSPVTAQTATPNPTSAISTDPHPLQIEVERNWQYPGSEIKFEENLPSRPTYDQYIVSYQSDGYKIYAYMAIPKGTKPETGWPAIILNHGYSNPETYVTTEKYIAFMDVLSRSGYIVFKPDFRAHGNSEGTRPIGGGYGSPDYMIDTLNALASLQSYQDADPERIGMVGHSMGGAITLRAMVVSKNIRAGVIWSGVVAPYETLIYRWNHSAFTTSSATPNATPQPTSLPGYRSSISPWAIILFEKYGSPEENPDFWNSISPSSYLQDLSGPLQLQAGTGDTQVPYIWSVDLGKMLESKGLPYEVFIYENDNHNLNNNFLVAIARTRAFFDKYVKNYQP